MNSLFNITNKKAIVTGGTRGLGYGAAEALCEAGCEVVIIGSSEKVFETSAEFSKRGFNCKAVQADLSIKEENYRAFNEAVGILGGFVDILVNAAGMITRHLPEDFPSDEWDNTLTLDLTSVWIMCQEAGKLMLKKGCGKIINIASMLSFFGGQTVPAYAAAKGGVMQLTKALSNDWAGRGINVNAIAPGYMATDMTSAIQNNPERFKNITERIPKGRWGTPDDLKGVTLFLSSPASDYICGAIIPVDGGYLVK